MKRDLLIAAVIVVLAGLGIGVVVLLPWLQHDDTKPLTVAPKPEPIALMPKKEEPKKPAPSAKRQPVVLTALKEKPKPQTTTPIDNEVQPLPKKIDVKIEPTAKQIEQNKIISVGDDLFGLRDPAAEYTVKSLHRNRKITLVGKIKTLKIAGANEGSVLDVSGLTAEEIIFTGNVNSGSTVILGKAKSIKILDVNDRSTIDASASEASEIVLTGAVNSGSTLKLGAAKGSIEILGEINDRAQIDIAAPDGKVVFKSRSGSVINGDAKLTIVAKDVEFAGAINGTQTQVSVTLTKGGSLKFRRVNGGVRLLWNKADAGDPAPRIESGSVDGAAVFRMAPAAKK